MEERDWCNRARVGGDTLSNRAPYSESKYYKAKSLMLKHFTKEAHKIMMKQIKTDMYSCAIKSKIY